MLVPVGDEERTSGAFAWLVACIVLTNLGIFAWTVSQGASEMEDILGTFGARPHLLLKAPALYWHTAFSSMFLHVSWGHVLGNMLFLWIFGRTLEDEMGEVKLVLLYLGCGLVALAAHCASTPRSVLPVVGASGAVAGLMGAFLRCFHRHRIRMQLWLLIPLVRFRVPAWLCLGVWFAGQALALRNGSGREAGIAVAAHLGGFITGFGALPWFVGGTQPHQGGTRS